MKWGISKLALRGTQTKAISQSASYADPSLKPDYANMTCPKHDYADPHYTYRNVVYTPSSC